MVFSGSNIEVFTVRNKVFVVSFFRNIAIKSMVGSSGRQRVQIGALKDIDIKVPSLEEQRRIASRLALLDSKIALNSRINDNLF